MGSPRRRTEYGGAGVKLAGSSPELAGDAQENKTERKERKRRERRRREEGEEEEREE